MADGSVGSRAEVVRPEHHIRSSTADVPGATMASATRHKPIKFLSEEFTVILTFLFRRADPSAGCLGVSYAQPRASLARAWCRCPCCPFRKEGPSGGGFCLSYIGSRPSLARAWCRCSRRLFRREDLSVGCLSWFARPRRRQTRKPTQQLKLISSQSSP